jgi:peptidyl-prolyl cis-trans isomerase C
MRPLAAECFGSVFRGWFGVSEGTGPTEWRQEMSSAAARHILVETQEQCEDLKTQIEGGADFSEMAKQHSKCPSGQKGGDLGTFSPGQMVKEFDDVVFSAEVGKVQGPVQTQFGFHLIEITQRTE